MANRREEERARLREAREEKEKTHTSSERKRLMLGYGVAGVIGLVVIAGIVVAVVSSGGGGGERHRPTSTPQSGSTNGVQPDDRTGTKPPPSRSPNLQQAAKQAGCVLRLHLKDEGHEHIPPGSEAPGLQDQPADLGQPRRTALPAGRRRLQRNAAADRLRPLARARPHGDPVQPRPARNATSSN